MNTPACSRKANGTSAAAPLHACEEAFRIVAHVQRIALDSAEHPASEVESREALFSVPIRLIPYVERIRALRRELARERAARAALHAALASFIGQLDVRGGAPIAPEDLVRALRALG